MSLLSLSHLVARETINYNFTTCMLISARWDSYVFYILYFLFILFSVVPLLELAPGNVLGFAGVTSTVFNIISYPRICKIIPFFMQSRKAERMRVNIDDRWARCRQKRLLAKTTIISAITTLWHGGLLWSLELHPETMEVHYRAVKAPPRATEAHFEDVEAHPGAVEAPHGAVKAHPSTWCRFTNIRSYKKK